MRYPPVTHIQPSGSVVYRAFAGLLTIILIAASAHIYWANGQFDLKIGVWMAFSVCAITWLLHDAWMPQNAQQGQLMYSEGRWFWQEAGQETQGTLRLHLDLGSYMLASFAPTNMQSTHPFFTTTQWFHLEARAFNPAVRASAWLALRRAICASAQPSHEELAT